MEIFIVILAVVLLFVDYLVAGAFYDIAKMKGYNSRKYYWYCFFTGIAGYLMVIALPNKGGSATISTNPTFKINKK